VATPSQPSEPSGAQPDTPSGVTGLVRLLAKVAAREAVVRFKHGEPSDRHHLSEDLDEADR
jgi:hypothetical protein